MSSKKIGNKVQFDEYDGKSFRNKNCENSSLTFHTSTSSSSLPSNLSNLPKEKSAQKNSSSRISSLERQLSSNSAKYPNSKKQSDSASHLQNEFIQSDVEGKKQRSNCTSQSTNYNSGKINENSAIYKSKSLDGRVAYPEKILNRKKVILSQSNFKSKTASIYGAKDQSSIRSAAGQFPSIKRSVSQSPSRISQAESENESNKENERTKHKKRFQSQEPSNKMDLPPNGKSHKHDCLWKVEDNIMWMYNSSGARRAGYILFKCDFSDENSKSAIAQKYDMNFKFSQADSKLIRILMEAHGIKEVNSTCPSFNLYWGNSHFSPNEMRPLQEWQKINHFPRSSELTRKDRLYMNIKRMQRQCGVKLFDFIPTSFVLPTEYRDFCDTHLRERGTWIVKPVASSQGKGIYLVSQVDQVQADETSLVCRYLESPLLVNGYKCDLRLYVLVTSLDPLVVYLYEEGLVRLATIKYQHGKNLWNPCIHLTNYSVNKFNSNYVQNEDPEVDDQGNKWSLSAFLRYLKARGTDTGALMRSVEDVIIKSILSAAFQMNTATNMFIPHPRNCFELYGFDILIDSQLKPWVLEVNLSPSLNVDQPLDLKIKSAMLADMFSLIGLQVVNPNTTKASNRHSVYRKLPNLRHSSDSFDRGSSRSRFGASSGFLTPSHEELKVFRQLQAEFERKGGWARIFPTPDSWAMYGSLQEYSSPVNLIFHLHLFPHVPKNNKYHRTSPLKMSCVSSSGLASSLERLSCYERALPKAYSYLHNIFGFTNKSKDENRNCRDIDEVKASLVAALENGVALSKYQARMAFSVYLQHVQRRLMIGSDQEKQTDLVYRFLRSATRTLQLPFSVQVPSKTLPHEARAVVMSKQLGDFIHAYTKETQLYIDSQASGSCTSLSSQCPNSSVQTPSEPKSYPSIQSLPGSSATLDSNDTNDSLSKSSEGEAAKNSSTPLSAHRLSESNLTLPSISSRPSRYSSNTSSALTNSLVSLCKPSSSCSSSSSLQTIDGSIKDKQMGQSKPKIKIPESDSGICTTDDEGTMNADGSFALPGGENKGKKQQSEQEDGVAMDLYKSFLFSAGESDLEEVLNLQTRIHKSAGVFLDPTRRGRPRASSSSDSLSHARTPTASPHGSPRKARKSPVNVNRNGNHLQGLDTVTNEPLPSVPEQKKPSSSTSILAGPSSACCLFGNILKASLKRTKVHF